MKRVLIIVGVVALLVAVLSVSVVVIMPWILYRLGIAYPAATLQESILASLAVVLCIGWMIEWGDA